jgi:hypothetical protein
MHRSHGIDVDRVLAWCCVLVAHVLALWWLTRPHVTPPPGIESDGLDVVWIEPAQPVAPMPPPADVPTQSAPSAMAAVHDETSRRTEAPSSSAPTAEAVVDPDPAPALSAVFIEQGSEWVQQQHRPDDFARNPLTHRTVPRAEPRRDRFVMREAITPASVVASIGKLLGGPDYMTDPCPRIRDNITNLATGGPSELLDEELRRDRQLCR